MVVMVVVVLLVIFPEQNMNVDALGRSGRRRMEWKHVGCLFSGKRVVA